MAGAPEATFHGTAATEIVTFDRSIVLGHGGTALAHGVAGGDLGIPLLKLVERVGTPVMRLARNEEGPALLSFVREMRAEFGVFVPNEIDFEFQDLQRYYFARGGTFVVLECDGEVVGTMALFAHDSQTCELRKFYLKPEWRGAGNGRAMLTWLMGYARRSKFRHFVIDLDFGLRTGNRLYRRMGFRRLKQGAEPIPRQHDYLVSYHLH